MKKRFFSILITLSLILMMFLGSSIHVSANDAVPAYAAKTDLIVYKSTDVGDVYVWNNDETIFVQYETTGNWFLKELHTEVAPDWSLIPQTTNLNPIPGLFDVQKYFSFADQCKIYRFSINIPNDIEHGDLIAVAAHAKVSMLALEKKVSTIVTETAWGLGLPFKADKNSGMWFEYLMNRPPVASISYDPLDPNWCNLVTFDSSSSYDPDGDALSFEWDKDYDGITFNNESQATSFQQNFEPGEYTIALKVTDPYGAFSMDVVTISVINHTPLAEFHAGNANIAYWQQPFRFFNDSTDADSCDWLSYIWDFGDGKTTTSTFLDEYVDHSYDELGTYTVSLTATDQWNVQNTVSHEVTVYNNNPIADFIVMKSSLHYLEQPFQFFDMSTDPDEIGTPNLTYDWDFGDGTSGTAKDPTHTYSTLGVYTVTLTVTDLWGGTGTFSRSVEVFNTVPVALFSVGNDNISYTQQPFAFFNVSYDDDVLDNLDFTWTFVDCATLETDSYNMVTHSYSDLGTYTVSLKVEDGYGYYDSYTHNVTVYNNQPIAEFSVAGGFTVLLSNQPTQFFDESTDADYLFDPELTYLWYFGDGGTSTDQNPIHSYSEPGKYLVMLRVTDIWDSYNITNHWIEIVE